MTEREAEIDAWRAVAAGWERRRDLFWEATRVVSERMVELLDPRPGQTVLELAAGPGDTGLLAATRLGPDGTLISTDAAPEMVEVARRRAARDGARNVRFAIVDAAAIELDEASVDGVLCRYGLMLVPEMDAAASEIGRVLRPGGHAVLAVWAEPGRNDWMTAAGRAAVALGLAEGPVGDAPGPFRLAHVDRLRSVLEGGGLEVVLIEEVEVRWSAASLDEWWDVACDTSRMLGELVSRLDAEALDDLKAAAADSLASYVTVDGSVTVPGVSRVALARRAA